MWPQQSRPGRLAISPAHCGLLLIKMEPWHVDTATRFNSSSRSMVDHARLAVRSPDHRSRTDRLERIVCKPTARRDGPYDEGNP